MLERITKRDGTAVPFEPYKIKGAITKAFISARGSDDEDLIDRLTKAVVRLLKVSLKDKPEDTIINVEEVQDAVETILIKYNLPKVAKEYILFRDCHNKIRKTKYVMINAQTLVGDYIDKLDWRVNENANSGYSYASMLNHISGSVVANYTLSNIYPERIAKAHRDGDFHIHDLSAGIIPYCMGHSLKELLMMGFVGSGGRASSKPAKHLDSALQQISNFMATLQTEAAGAQAFSSWDTYLAPFVRNDGLTYQQVKQAVQQFIFGLNIASRWGQCPFTNLTMDLVPPSDLKDMPVIIGGELQDTTYGEYQTEMDMLNKAFIETMIEGDAEGKIFTFPIPTYNIVKDFDWEGDVAKKLFELTCKFGSPYFANYLNSDMNPSDSRSMCCRLRLDLKELRRKNGGLFGSGELTGSSGVCTINMPRIGYLASNKEEFFSKLEYLMVLAKDSLEIKRKIAQANIDNGLLPYTKIYVKSLKNHFSTIGLVGLNEACLNLLGCDLTTPEGQDFGVETLEFMRSKMSEFQEETGNLFNLEGVPAEATAYRLAKIDKEKFGDIITAGTDEVPYYTNSSQIPVGYTDDIFEACDLQDRLQPLYTGGIVQHLYLGERIEDPAQAAKLIKKLCENYKIPYFSLTPTFSICKVHGYIPGNHSECPYDKDDVIEKPAK